MPQLAQAYILDDHVAQNEAFAPKCHLTSDLHMTQCCQIGKIGKSYTHAHPSRQTNAFIASASKHYDAKYAQQRKKISHQLAKAHAVYMIAAERGAASVHCPADKLRVHSLKEQCEPLLCPTHYQQCVGHATCAWCKSRLTPEHRWKSPNFQLAEHVLRSMHHVRISDESRFCRRCYQKQIDMLPADNAPSTDHQLRSIISQYSTEGAESDFPNIIVIAATGRELLGKDAILLTTGHDLYTETLHPAADPKPAVYVLSKLKLTLEHHLHVIPPKSRKDGTLLLRNGCNVMLRRHYI